MVLDRTRITKDELVADDWSLCQQLGAEAHARGDLADLS